MGLQLCEGRQKSLKYAVAYGDVIQSLTRFSLVERTPVRDVSIDLSHEQGEGTIQVAFWMVVAILSRHETSLLSNTNAGSSYLEESYDHSDKSFNGLYGLVVPCSIDVDGVITLHKDVGTKFILPVEEHVRRVMLMHKCGDETGITTSTVVDGKVKHTLIFIDNGTYMIHGRCEGYLPRSA